jgi:hypothetical protein
MAYSLFGEQGDEHTAGGNSHFKSAVFHEIEGMVPLMLTSFFVVLAACTGRILNGLIKL